jgi:hypothetical protein
MRVRLSSAIGPNLRTGKTPSATFSATDNAGTRRSSWGIVTIPAAIASCGLANAQGLPDTKIRPLSGRWTPPRMRMSVDLPAPFSPTMAWISPGRTSKSTASSAIVASNRLQIASARTTGRPPLLAAITRCPSEFSTSACFAAALELNRIRFQRGTNATRIFSSVNFPCSMITSLSRATVQSRMGTS